MTPQHKERERKEERERERSWEETKKGKGAYHSYLVSI